MKIKDLNFFFLFLVTAFAIAIVGLAPSLYETSGFVQKEYNKHCSIHTPGSADYLSCLSVYNRNKGFYQTVLELSLIIGMISGVKALYLLAQNKTEKKLSSEIIRGVCASDLTRSQKTQDPFSAW